MLKLPHTLLACLVLLAACSDKPAPKPEQTQNQATPATSPNARVEPQLKEDCAHPAPLTAEAPLTRLQLDGVPLIDPRSYSYGYWLNGFRKNEDDTSPDQLCLETGHYGLMLDLGNLQQAKFGRINHDGHYGTPSTAGAQTIQNLAPAELSIQLGSSGKVFTAKRSIVGPADNARRLQDTRLWESGRYLQNFDIQHLVFEDDSGNELSCDARLQVVGWHNSLTLTAEIKPTLPFVDGPNFGVTGNGYTVLETPITLDDLRKDDSPEFTMECWVYIPRNPATPNHGWLLSKNGSQNDDGYIGFYSRGHRIEAVLNTGGGPRNRHTLREQTHKLFNFDAWNHLALSYDGDTARYYVNGRMESSKEINSPRKATAGAIQLGQMNNDAKDTAYGTFDQIRLWNRALSKDEIEAHIAHPETASAGGLLYEKTFDTRADPQPKDYLWKDVTTRIQLATTDQSWEERSPTIESWQMGETKTLTLQCDLAPDEPATTTITVHTADGKNIQAAHSPELNCQVAEVKKLNRSWSKGYTDIRDYDEFTIELEHSGTTQEEVPFMLYLRDVANITGLVPILCHEDGTPTGIHVQLSKNWHYGKLGAYLRAYTLIPALPGKQTYKLRIAYGFYGTLPSASHAQLSLVGYGGNGRWDQLAIGCWGETICFDVDRSCVDVAVTDVRMLMARIGADGKKWSWTNAGWGGDWLQTLNSEGKRHHPSELKTSYLAHGPCLTDVHYQGSYGSQREINFNTVVNTLRTDDYARTFQKFHYTFNEEVSAKDAWLFKMGRTHHYATPVLAYGNAAGLITEEAPASTLKENDYLIEQTEIEGSAPWWVSFPGAGQTRDDGKGNGYRALVIRSYRATFDGTTYTQPSISAPVFKANNDGTTNLDLLLTAPKGVETFKLGDTIEMDLEWITLHREADDYYGPNEAYRQHISNNPNSWKTTYREAIGNDLKVKVTGGELIKSYPIQVHAQAKDIGVQIIGGVGYVPIRFEGLPSATGYTLYQIKNGTPTALDQAVHGNDFWQVDYNSETNSYNRTYNLPLDGLETSEWILKKQ